MGMRQKTQINESYLTQVTQLMRKVGGIVVHFFSD